MQLRLLFLYTLFFLAWTRLVPPVLAQTPTTSGLVGYWPFNETAGTTASDASGSGYHGTLVNNPSWSPSGRIGGCLGMQDNTGRYVNIPGMNWQPTSFTVSFWMNPYSYTQYTSVIGSTIGWGGFIFHSSPSGEVYVGTNVNNYLYLGGGTLQLNKWQHFTFSYMSGVGKFYKNGQLLASRSDMSAPAAWGGLLIGGGSQPGALHGKIDEFRVYNRALSDQEVSDLADWPTPVTFYWKADAVNSSWNNAANWVKGNVPTAGGEVVINSCSNCPVVTSALSLSTLTLLPGSQIDLGTQLTHTIRSIHWREATIRSTGSRVNFSRGEAFHHLQFTGPITLDLDRSPSDAVWTNGGSNHFAGSVTLIHRGGGNFNWGNDQYADQVHFINYGWGWFYINGDFPKKVTFQNETGCAFIAYTGSAIFRDELVVENRSDCYVGFADRDGTRVEVLGKATLSNLSTGFLPVGGEGTVTFHQAVELNCTSNAINFSSWSGRVILKPTATLQIGQIGFTGGKIHLKNFIHENATAVTNLQASPNAPNHTEIIVGPDATFAGELNLRSADIKLNGVICQKAAKIERYGYSYGTAPFNLGGNVFNGPTTLINSGGNDWYFGHSAKDVFNGDLTVTHSGGNGTYLSHWSAGHEFNGNIAVNMTDGSWGLIAIGANGGTTRLKEGKTLSVGSFKTGSLAFYNLTQLGETPQTLTLTNSSYLYLGYGLVFHAPIKVTVPQLYLNGSIYYQPAHFTKTGNGDNNSYGNNTFYSKIKILNQATSGMVNLATQSPDVFLPAPAN